MIFNKKIDYQNISLNKYNSLKKKNKIELEKQNIECLLLNNHCNGEFIDDYKNNEEFIKLTSIILNEGVINISPLLLWNKLDVLNINSINQRYLIEIYKLTDKTKKRISDYVTENIEYSAIDKIFYKQRYFIDHLYEKYNYKILDNEYIDITDKVRLITKSINELDYNLIDNIPNSILEDENARKSIVLTLLKNNIFYNKNMNKLYLKDNDYIRISLIKDPLLIKYVDDNIPLSDNVLSQIAETIKDECVILSYIPNPYKKSEKCVLNMLEVNPKLLDKIGDVSLSKMIDKIPLYKNYVPNEETPIIIQNRFDYLIHFLMLDINNAKYFWAFIPKNDEEIDFLNSYYNARKKELDDMNIKLFQNGSK